MEKDKCGLLLRSSFHSPFMFKPLSTDLEIEPLRNYKNRGSYSVGVANLVYFYMLLFLFS